MDIIVWAFLNLQWSMRKFLQVPPIDTNPFDGPGRVRSSPVKVIPVTRNGFPSTPCNWKGTK